MKLQPDASDFRQTLISTSQGLHIDSWQLTRQHLDQPATADWSITKRSLRGGKQEGVDLIEVDNGKLRLVIVPTRGMGILRVDAGDLRLGWDSPVQEVVHPHFVNLQSRGGLGWLDGFNEWLVRCGLEFAGGPGKDKFINNVGDEAEMDLTLHGKIANIPASEVEVIVDRQPPHRLRVRGKVNERMFYGPKLELWTEISLEPGADGFRVDDCITNRGVHDQEFQLLYHVNFGPPLLEAGSRFIAPIKQVTPINRHAAEAVKTFAEYAGPTPGFVEQVYCLTLYGDRGRRTQVLLQNAAADRAVSLSFALAQLPCVTLWKNTAPREEGYVTGIEPATSFPHNRRIERNFGRVPKLAAGASRRFTIDYQVHADRKAVRAASQAVAAIQGDLPTKIETEPARLE